ncbi:hypothetical protein acdb102_31080 [Acidothermaceae bacterium B102]|nr:hypothetical protein acdb102_31080 [Acidothermaceae bacterium B102]
MPLLACLTCKALTSSSYCPAHAPKRKPHTRSASQRGYNSAWQRTSKAAIAEQPWCSYCGKTTDLTGDHILPRAAGGTNDRANVSVLCRGCNGRKKDRT